MGITATVLSVLLFKPTATKQTNIIRDYETIKQSGIIRAVTEYNSISYHAVGDSIEGFHYELLKAFAQEKGLKAEIIATMSLEERWNGLQSGKYDILANNVLITAERQDTLLCTNPIILNKQVLIQRKAQHENDSLFVNSQLDLAQKTIHIVKDSPYKLRIQNLSHEIGDTIYVKEVDKYGQEHLLAMVAYGDIDYAVCDESLAKASINEYPQLDMQTAISFTQFYSWGVHKNNTALLDTLNLWLDTYKQTQEFKKLKQKYYKE